MLASLAIADRSYQLRGFGNRNDWMQEGSWLVADCTVKASDLLPQQALGALSFCCEVPTFVFFLVCSNDLGGFFGSGPNCVTGLEPSFGELGRPKCICQVQQAEGKPMNPTENTGNAFTFLSFSLDWTPFAGGSSSQAASQKVLQPGFPHVHLQSCSVTNVENMWLPSAMFERFVRPDLTEAVLVATGFKEVRAAFVDKTLSLGC